MNASEVIEAYVAEVAARLPRAQRVDVAFELRALLGEELQEKAAAAGRSADAGMATELLRAFGRPADVAARYRPTLTVIDPADGHAFVRATVIGLAVIWSLGLLGRLGGPLDSAGAWLGVLGAWWGGTVLPSLWWPGLLVVGFGLAAWSRRRHPQRFDWKPRAEGHVTGGRAALALALVGIVLGVGVLLEPRWLLDAVFGGRAAPAAYEALTYTDTFRGRQAPWLLVLLLANLPLLGAVLVKGRWTPFLRRMQMVLSLATCAAMMWTVLDGPVFLGTASDRLAKPLLVIITVASLLEIGLRHYRGIKRTPKALVQG